MAEMPSPGEDHGEVLLVRGGNHVGVAHRAAGLGDRRGAGVDPTQPPSVPELTPTLSSIQSLVFTPQCVTHHGDSEAEAGLNLEEGKSFAALVNVPSTQVALDLVEPNDAENSYLIHKLDGRDGIVGDRIPEDADFLSEADIDVIKQWINDGAEDN